MRQLQRAVLSVSLNYSDRQAQREVEQLREQPFVAEWLGREPELRRRRDEIWEKLEQAEEENDPEYALLWAGQSAGLIDAVVPAADVVREIVRDAAEILGTQLQAVLREEAGA